MKHNTTCWIITEGLIGTENQCIGVANSLKEKIAMQVELKRIALNQPWRILSPYLGLECATTFAPELKPPYPDLLITSGRKAIAASRYIKRKSGGKTFTVHIQDPRISPKHFDFVAVPKHDPMRGKNVIVTTASPNKITPEGLASAAGKFPHLAKSTKPKVAVLIGGNSKAHKLNTDVMERLCVQLKILSKNYSLMITTSRRTGAENELVLHNALRGSDAYIWDGKEINPYLAMLSIADFIIVTNDSASMLSDAASTGKPTYMVALEGGGTRLNTLHENLKTYGAVRDFNGVLENWDYTPLNDSQMIADIIAEKLDAR